MNVVQELRSRSNPVNLKTTAYLLIGWPVSYSGGWIVVQVFSGAPEIVEKVHGWKYEIFDPDPKGMA